MKVKRDYTVKIDEDNGITIITKKNIEDDIANMLYKRNISYEYEDVKLPHKIVVRAKCNPEDSFDKQIGVDIAKQRYKSKYRMNCTKIIDKVINRKLKEIEELVTIKNKFLDE